MDKNATPPPASPRKVYPAAAVALWRPNAAGGFQIYLVQRAANLAHYAGFWCFVGGAVEACDRAGAPGAAWVHAAARELFEETGVWLAGASATVASSQPFALSPATRQALRASLHKEPHRFAAALQALGLAVTYSAFVPCGFWRTPPFGGRTFEAQYFAVELPQGCAPELDAYEAEQGRWLTPWEALHAHAAGGMLMTYPVCHTVGMLAAAASPNNPAPGDAIRLHKEGDATVAAMVGAGAARAQALPDSFARRHAPLVPGVRMVPLRTPTLPPATHTNCYLLGEAEMAIVDPGTPYAEDQAAFVAALATLEAAGARVAQIWLTHAHPDHTGAIACLQARFGAPVWAHAGCLADLSASSLPPPDQTFADGDTLRLAGGFAWEVLHTPGHALGHVCFYCAPQRLLLSGDNVLGVGTPMVPPSPHGSMSAYCRSLTRLAALDVRLLLPGHGPPVAVAQAQIARTLAQRRAREAQIWAGLTATPKSIDRLLAEIYAHVPDTVRPWARLSLLAHLEKMAEEGAIVLTDRHAARVGASL